MNSSPRLLAVLLVRSDSSRLGCVEPFDGSDEGVVDAEGLECGDLFIQSDLVLAEPL